MHHFKNLEEEVLSQFLQNLKERSRADSSLITEDTIDKLGLEILDNLQAKNDLFAYFKLDQESQQELHQLQEQPLYSDQEEEEKKETQRELTEEGTKEGHQEDSNSEWEREYEEEMDLTDKIVGLSRKASNLHIAGVYDQKNHKYISSKDVHRFSIGPLLLKTEEQEYLVSQMQCTLSRGIKHQLMSLSQDLLKRDELKDYSQDEKELLMYEIEDN